MKFTLKSQTTKKIKNIHIKWNKWRQPTIRGKFCYKTFQHVLALTKFAKFNVISNHQGQQEQQEQHYYMDILSNNLVVTKVNEQTMVRTLPINVDSLTSKLEYEYQNLARLTKKINIP